MQPLQTNRFATIARPAQRVSVARSTVLHRAPALPARPPALPPTRAQASPSPQGIAELFNNLRRDITVLQEQNSRLAAQMEAAGSNQAAVMNRSLDRLSQQDAVMALKLRESSERLQDRLRQMRETYAKQSDALEATVHNLHRAESSLCKAMEQRAANVGAQQH